MSMEPLKVVCTRKEASCVITNLFAEVLPVCDVCESLQDADFVLGGTIAGAGDECAYIKLTEYGFEYYGDEDLLEAVRGARCMLHGTLTAAKEDGGAAE